MKFATLRPKLSSIKLPGLFRSVWIKLPLATIALLLVFLGVQYSYRPADYKHPARHVTIPKQHSKTQPQTPDSSSTGQTTGISDATAINPASNSSSHARPNAAPSGLLSTSPSQVVIYKWDTSLGPNPYLKASALSPNKHIQIAATDGVRIRNLSVAAPTNVIWYPPAAPFAPSLPIEVNAAYLAPGTYDYTASAQVASGATYTGTIELIVKPMPVFNVYAPVPLVASGSATSDDVTLSGFDELQIDLSQVDEFIPSLTLTVAGYSCHMGLVTSADDLSCDSALDSVPAGSYTGSLIFENQFQIITIPFSINVAP